MGFLVAKDTKPLHEAILTNHHQCESDNLYQPPEIITENVQYFYPSNEFENHQFRFQGTEELPKVDISSMDPLFFYQRAISYEHYKDIIMSVMASRITGLTIVYSSVYSGADQRKHQSSASLAFVRGIHRSPVNSPHKRPVTRKSFHLMTSSCHEANPNDCLVMASWYVNVSTSLALCEGNPSVTCLYFLTEAFGDVTILRDVGPRKTPGLDAAIGVSAEVLSFSQVALGKAASNKWTPWRPQCSILRRRCRSHRRVCRCHRNGGRVKPHGWRGFPRQTQRTRRGDVYQTIITETSMRAITYRAGTCIKGYKSH